MTVEISAADSSDERMRGRSWTVRLDAAERGGAAVRFSCNRPGCPERRLPSAAAGRAFAVAHLTAHLRAAAAPRPEAYCACRADGCHGHAGTGAGTGPAAARGPRGAAPVWRCGGAVVFAVVADRAGRWWRALECCARCAAAHPTAQVVTDPTAAVRTEGHPDRPQSTGDRLDRPQPTGGRPDWPQSTEGRLDRPQPTEDRPAHPRPTEGRLHRPQPTEDRPAHPRPTEGRLHRPQPTEDRPAHPRPTEARPDRPQSTGGRPDRLQPGALNPQFSHCPSAAAPPAPGGAGRGLPRPRPSGPPAAARPRRPRWQGRISQRAIPEGLRPTSLRDELVALGEEFRAYQKRPEPDLALLAELHARKARAFDLWADIVGDVRLRGDARRAEQAAATARTQHRHRTGDVGDGEEGAVERLLTKPRQWESARTVLAHVRDRAPLPGPEARLLTLLLTLRSARAGQGNVTGQDLTALPLGDPEDLVRRLTDLGWLLLPGTPADLLAARPENAVPVTVPSLVPGPDGTGVLGFGKHTRARVSGWSQRVVSDRKLRKARTPAAVRLLALSLAAHTTTDGRLGPDGAGLDVTALAALCATAPDDFGPLVERLAALDWLTGHDLAGDRLTGRLTERVLPLTCPLLPPGAPTGPAD